MDSPEVCQRTQALLEQRAAELLQARDRAISALDELIQDVIRSYGEAFALSTLAMLIGRLGRIKKLARGEEP